MADLIPGRQLINIGTQNQATGSDDLYTAFTKVETNFENLFANSSPYINVIGGSGIAVATPTGNTLTITNTGITNITPGTGITINNSNGAVTISVSGSLSNNVVAGVTNVGVRSSTLTVTNSPIISHGIIDVELPVFPTTANFSPGTYISPTITVDEYGRIVEVSNTNSSGTVTSVAVQAGVGMSVAGGPITTSGTITVTNTGVTQLNAGTGISLSGSNGSITVSSTVATNNGTVTRVDIASSTLIITNSPITTSGTISVELPANATFTTIYSGNITTGNITSNANIVATNANLGNLVTANYITVNNNTNVTGLITASSGNITGNLTVANANVTANIKAGNANVTGTLVTGTANVTGLITASSGNITGNVTIGNTLAVGNITTTNGIFWANGKPYSPPAPNILMSSISANTAIATTTQTTFAVDNISYSGNVLIYNNVAVDTESGYSTSNGKFTPTVSGYYQIEVSFSPYIVSLGAGNSSLSDGTSYFILLVKNGTTLVGVGNQVGGTGLGSGSVLGLFLGITQSSINTIVQMNGTTDYLQVFLIAKINSGSFTNNNTLANYLQAIWLRP
jgi:hypothetical protein